KNYPYSDYTANSRYWLYKLTPHNSPDDIIKLMADMCTHNPGSSYTLSLLSSEIKKRSVDKLEKNYLIAKSKNDIEYMTLYHSLLFIKKGYDSSYVSRIKDFSSGFLKPYIDLEKMIKNPSYESKYSKTLYSLEKYFAA